MRSQIEPKCLCLVYLVLVFVDSSHPLVLRAYISQHGLHGEIEFSQKNQSITSIRTNLRGTLQHPDAVFRWTLHELPVDYRDVTPERCSEDSVGKEVVDLTEELGFLIIPGKEQAEFESSISLTGPGGLWGKSLVLETAERDRLICASILSTEALHERHAVAKFSSPIAGDLHFRWLSAREFDETDSYIQADLYHTRAVTEKTEYTQHNWKLFVTDIFDSDKGNYEDNCNVLQMVFDPESSGDGMSVGDLDTRLGKIRVATDGSVQKVKTLYKNEVINVLRSDMEETKRSLYVVIFDHRHGDSFLACAKLRLLEPKTTKVLINQDGIRGTVEFSQRSPFDPTWTNFQLGTADQDYESNLRFVSSIIGYSIGELPPNSADVGHLQQYCNSTGALYNPTELEPRTVPPPGLSTQDQYPVGDLFGKYKERTEYLNHKYLLPGLAHELSGAYWDVYLPLTGARSVLHRGLRVTRRAPKSDLCGTILPYEHGTEHQVPLTTAQAVFRYPLVGRVLLRQPRNRPWEDTTIIVESLIHADGAAVNTTHGHRWAIHSNPPGSDYYNWTGRCLSAGDLLEPYHLHVDLRNPSQHCRGLPGLCRLGDLGTRHGPLSIAGSIRSAGVSRRLFTDSALALDGRHTVLRRSLLLFDDHGPVARGERLACATIGGYPRRKAVVRDWYGNGQEVPVTGRLEVLQQTEYDVANVEVALDGLDDVRTYRVHVAPVEKDLEFPCEAQTLLGTYNPYNVSRNQPPPLKGTADQYQLGDLGQKYGGVSTRAFSTHFNDTQLSLFGPQSVLGRSVVLHKKSREGRWACSSVERGYSPSEAREIRAIASFHHPGGFAWGYVRLTQLIHHDGSASDTVLELNLRHPGDKDRNLTHNHNWNIFVNPVGVDAAVAVTHTRCVAGGYRWNPHFTQLADPLNRDLYEQECGPNNPLRCDVGDLTSRLGPISIGGARQVFQDSNLPLEGPVSAVGRSLVLFGPERSPERFACANIEPDNDIIKFVNIMKPPRFVVGHFLSSIRSVLGAAPWMVSVEARRSRLLPRASCIQLLLHFHGPHAHRLELDFTRLIASGRLDAPSVSVPGFVDAKRRSSVPYRACGLADPNHKKSHFFASSSGERLALSELVVFLLVLRYLNNALTEINCC